MRTKSRSPRETALRRAKPKPPENLRRRRAGVPDMNSPHFRREVHRQWLLIATSKGEKEDQDFIDAVSDPDSK